jgi:hypothetical protein
MTDIIYGPKNRNWDESKKPELIGRFNQVLEYLRSKGEVHFEPTEAPASKTGFIPYVDGIFNQDGGVIIRNITKSSMEDEDKLRSSLDDVYYAVMGQ